MKKLIAIIICSLMITTLFTACKQEAVDLNSGSEETIQDYPVKIDEIEIPSRPQKVAVLSKEIAQIILTIGCEETLVLASDDCTQTELEVLPKISKDDVQAVVDEEVDLVIARDLSKETLDAFKEAGITAINIPHSQDRTDFERLYSNVGSIMMGATTGKEQALEESREIFTTLDDVGRIIPESGSITTVVVMLDLDKSALTGGYVADTILDYLGVTNIFKGLTDNTYTYDQFRIANPMYIFCPKGLRSEIMKDPRYQDITAVKNKQVYEIDVENAFLEGRSLVQFSTDIAAKVYPELLDERDEETNAPDVKPTQVAPSLQPTVTPAVTPYVYQTLQKGDKNGLVLAMNGRLQKLEYLNSIPNDEFTDDTVKIVKEFQKNSGLAETGIADHETLTKLYSDTTPTKSEANSAS